MRAHPSRRTALTLMAMLLAGMTFGAPVALAAAPSHAPARHLVWPHAQSYVAVRATLPHAPAVQSPTDDPFATIHME